MPVTHVQKDPGRHTMTVVAEFAATYYMTGPEGDTPHGWWRVKAVEAMEQLIAMGMEEGMPAAMGQIDPLLAEG